MPSLSSLGTTAKQKAFNLSTRHRKPNDTLKQKEQKIKAHFNAYLDTLGMSETLVPRDQVDLNTASKGHSNAAFLAKYGPLALPSIGLTLPATITHLALKAFYKARGQWQAAKTHIPFRLESKRFLTEKGAQDSVRNELQKPLRANADGVFSVPFYSPNLSDSPASLGKGRKITFITKDLDKAAEAYRSAQKSVELGSGVSSTENLLASTF